MKRVAAAAQPRKQDKELCANVEENKKEEKGTKIKKEEKGTKIKKEEKGTKITRHGERVVVAVQPSKHRRQQAQMRVAHLRRNFLGVFLGILFFVFFGPCKHRRQKAQGREQRGESAPC